MKHRNIFLFGFEVLGFAISIVSCRSLGFDRVTYISLINGYKQDIVIEVVYSEKEQIKAKLSEGHAIIRHEKIKTMRSIKVYNDESNKVLANYSEDDLEKLKNNPAVVLECWVVDENGIILLPDKYQYYSEWRKYKGH